MSDLNVNSRRQVEDALGRKLLPNDLIEVAAVDRLTPQQVEIVRILARNQLLGALLYLQAVIPEETSTVLNRYIFSYA